MVGTNPIEWDWLTSYAPEERTKFLMEISAASSEPRKCDTTEMADWESWWLSGMDE